MAEGWAAFEQTCKEVGAGELPQLLRYVKMATTPTPTPTPSKYETKQEEMDVEATAMTSADPPKIGEFTEKPIHISVGGRTKMYKCGNCNIIWTPIYGLPYPCCPHKEGPSVLLLCIQHIQHGFSTMTQKGPQVGPSLEWTGVMS